MADDPMRAADAVFAGFQQISDMLNGCVATMTREGWSDGHARAVVVSWWVQAMAQASR